MVRLSLALPFLLALESHASEADRSNEQVLSMLRDLQAKVDRHEEKVASYESTIAELQEQVRHLSESSSSSQRDMQKGNQLKKINKKVKKLIQKTACINGESSAANLIFRGCDVHVQNGQGKTAEINGKGNLIIGYNERKDENGEDDCGYGLCERSGSHNLVLGIKNDYKDEGYGGLVAGERNTLEGPYCTIAGGFLNTCFGEAASVAGGFFNDAQGQYSHVSGGFENEADGDYSAIVGGEFNDAQGELSSIVGGAENIVPQEAYASTILGGEQQQVAAAGSHVTIPAL